MIPYLVTFLISIFFIYVGESNKNNKIGGRILVLLGLIFPCLLAAFRNVSIGTDTKGYVYNLYKFSSESNNLFAFFDKAYIYYSQKNYLYLLNTYIIGKNNLPFGLLLFINEALVIFPIYFSFKILKFNRNKILIGMITFYFIFYNSTLNIVRQSIAIAFIVLSFSQYIKSENIKKKILSYIYLFIAMEFHTTAIISIILLWGYKFYSSKKINEKTKQTVSILCILFSVLIVIFYKQFLTFLAKSGIFTLATLYLRRYLAYDFSFYQFVINIIIFFMITFNKNYFIKNECNYNYLILLSIINLNISSGLGYFIMFSQRIMYYTQYILLFCFISHVKIDTENKKMIYDIYIFLLLISWILYIGIKNTHETVPYII